MAWKLALLADHVTISSGPSAFPRREWNSKRTKHYKVILVGLQNTSAIYIVASELNNPICHSNECQIGSFSSEATIYSQLFMTVNPLSVEICLYKTRN